MTLDRVPGFSAGSRSQRSSSSSGAGCERWEVRVARGRGGVDAELASATAVMLPQYHVSSKVRLSVVFFSALPKRSGSESRRYWVSQLSCAFPCSRPSVFYISSIRTGPSMDARCREIAESPRYLWPIGRIHNPTVAGSIIRVL
jgi:hypothetical protein